MRESVSFELCTLAVWVFPLGFMFCLPNRCLKGKICWIWINMIAWEGEINSTWRGHGFKLKLGNKNLSVFYWFIWNLPPLYVFFWYWSGTNVIVLTSVRHWSRRPTLTNDMTGIWHENQWPVGCRPTKKCYIIWGNDSTRAVYFFLCKDNSHPYTLGGLGQNDFAHQTQLSNTLLAFAKRAPNTFEKYK